MEDVELSDLVRQFQVLQREEVPNQISERNTVEIVNALLRKNLVQLLYTTDAKEYLTWDELQREVVSEVEANSGRLNVVELPNLVGVHAFQVERVLPDILKNSNIRLEGGELMTDGYLETTVQDAADVLKENGTLSLVEFATRFHFSSAFAQKILRDAVDSGELAAVFQGTSLYTKQFVHTQKIILRAGLLAATQPVDLPEFFARHDLFSPMMEFLVAEVCSSIPGSVEGRRFIPRSFDQFRSEQVQNIYVSNGFIEYDTLQRLDISNPKQYLLQRFNDTEAGAESPNQSSAAGRRGRKKSASKPAALKVVRATEANPLSGHALSAGFLADRLLANLVVLQSIVDGEVLALDLAEHLPIFVDASKDMALLLPRMYELYPGVERCEVVEDTVLLHPEAKIKVRAALLKALQSSPEEKNLSAKPLSARNKVVQAVLAATLALPADRYEPTLLSIADRWSDVLEEVFSDAEQTKARSAAHDLKRMRTALQDTLGSAWLELWVVAKGLQWAEAQLEEAASTALCRHVLSSRVLTLSCNVLLNESLDSAKLHEKVADLVKSVKQASALPKVLAAFPANARDALKPLTESTQGRSVEHYLDVLQDMSRGGVVAISAFHPPNKKAEREMYARLHDTARQEVSRMSFSSDAAASGHLFASLCSILVHEVFHVYLEVSGKSVGGVVARVLKEKDIPLLAEAHDVIVEALQRGHVEEVKAPLLEDLRSAVLAMSGA